MWKTVLATSGGLILCLVPACGVSACGIPNRSPPVPALDSSGDDAEDATTYLHRRLEMIREIEADVAATRHYTGKGSLDARVMDALRRVPRHEFVPPEFQHRAYENRPQPIGDGQTISQPYIVALMTDLLEIEPGDVVLEVGTGSGYQAAILAELAERVYSIEIIEPLGRAAAARLEHLGYENVETRIGDGYRGWPEQAPFDGIIVTAAAGEIPPPLVEQLKPGGRMVIPVASGLLGEQLTLLIKAESGETRTREILPVRFVPLTGDH